MGDKNRRDENLGVGSVDRGSGGAPHTERRDDSEGSRRSNEPEESAPARPQEQEKDPRPPNS